jgi:hypothetical protein
MFLGGACGVYVVMFDGTPPGGKQLLALALVSLFGTVGGGVLGLVLGLVRILFVRWRQRTDRIKTERRVER